MRPGIQFIDKFCQTLPMISSVKRIVELIKLKNGIVELKGMFLDSRVDSIIVRNRDTAAKKVEELIGFIREQRGQPVGYDEGLVRKLIEKVIVYNDSFKVVFKSGLEVEVDN